MADNEDRLYRAALAILRDPGEAEDAVQDAFLKLLERRPAFESPEHRRNWLMKVTVNGCKTRLRAPWRRRHVPLSEALPAPAPEERQEVEELFSLPPMDRAVLHLYYYEGYDTGEIADILGRSPGTVRSQLSRGRALLRDAWKGAEEL